MTTGVPPKAAHSAPTRTKAATEKAAGEPAAGETTANAIPGVNAETHKKGMKTPPATTKTTATSVETATPPPPNTIATAPPVAKASATPVATVTATPVAKVSATPMGTPVAKVSATPMASATPVTAAGANARPPGAVKKPDPQKVQQIKVEHANFKAQPKPEKVPPVTFTENRRIEGSDRWQGRQYDAFRSYHSERHDRGWYHSHYSRVELIGGGYYYWNNNYWYPAWGYNDAHQYYAYDGPIYVGHRAEPLDRVIADVQAVLQDMGYYKGEVDGLLGPLTRQALTSYQEEQGLAMTAAIDEPTLDALGMGS